jgi:hypothetical protein
MAMRIVGMWEIVSSPDFGDDHLNEEGTPFVRLHQDTDRVIGEITSACRPALWMAARTPTLHPVQLRKDG